MISIASIDVGNITTIGVSGENNIVVESRLKEWSNLDELGANEVIEFEGKNM